MRKVFRKFSARVAVLVADESGMSTVEYSTILVYTIWKGWLRASPDRCQVVPRHRRYNEP